jgi:glyoxylase-like metal-dependent hydrolase (beta-lactamase superfamily II)
MFKDNAAVASIATHKLRDNISVLEGSGGNIAVLSGPDGKVLIDGGIGASRPQLTKALADLGTDPISHLVNTHWHFDHTSGNEWLHAAGARRQGGIPSEVFAAEHTLKINGSTIRLKRYKPAHTDSDISVTFGEADVLHTGDTYWNGIYPFIDYSTGGSIDGMIAASDANLAATTNKTIVIPGHGGPVSNKSELQKFHDMLIAIRENVAALKKKGKSKDEIVAAKPAAAFDAKWGGGPIDPGFFTRLVYEGV